MEFEWDEDKAAANLAKHGVSFPYATRVFLDPYRLELENPEEGEGEIRFQTIGMVEQRLLLVVYTYRDTIIRMISARRTTHHEKSQYHEI
jgi:uncharacterized DUF497 family protein